jgi:hypothetical protein
MEKILTNEELQLGLSIRLRGLDEDEPNLAEAKTYGSLSGKLLSSVKRDMEAAERTGHPYLQRTKTFLGIE